MTTSTKANPVVSDPARMSRDVPGGKRSSNTREDPKRPLKLSILMPVYNEERTLRQAIEAVLAQTYPVEIELCVVDDGSTDASAKILQQIHDPRMRVRHHFRNAGKGDAMITARTMATGTHVVAFDADLEYSAEDLPRMLAHILAGRCEVVFGTRLFVTHTRHQSYKHIIGDRALTLATNLLFNGHLRDVHTCLKMMPLSLFRSLDLREPRFGVDAEIAARILQRGIRPFEIPVSYDSRTAVDGRKLTWRDGLICLGVLMRVRSTRPAEVAILQAT